PVSGVDLFNERAAPVSAHQVKDDVDPAELLLDCRCPLLCGGRIQEIHRICHAPCRGYLELVQHPGEAFEAPAPDTEDCPGLEKRLRNGRPEPASRTGDCNDFAF